MDGLLRRLLALTAVSVPKKFAIVHFIAKFYVSLWPKRLRPARINIKGRWVGEADGFQ